MIENDHELEADISPDDIEDSVPICQHVTEAEADRLAVLLQRAGIPVVKSFEERATLSFVEPQKFRVAVSRKNLPKVDVALEKFRLSEIADEKPAEKKDSIRTSAEALAVGVEWFAYPWFFVITQRLSFSLFEFWVTMLLCGASIGFAIAPLRNFAAPFWLYTMVIYIIVHCFCVALLGAVYELRKRGADGEISTRRRWGTLLFFQLPLLAAFALVGLLLPH